MKKTGFNYRILVVDDEAAVLDISALVLEDHGFEVRKAKDGFQALAELRRSTRHVRRFMSRFSGRFNSR